MNAQMIIEIYTSGLPLTSKSIIKADESMGLFAHEVNC